MALVGAGSTQTLEPNKDRYLRYGIITLTWCSPFSAARLDVVSRVAAAGFDSIELFVEDPDAFDVDELGRDLAANGLVASVCPQLHAERDPSSGDPRSRDAGVAYLTRCVDLAAAFGGSIVGGPLYGDQVFYGGSPAELRGEMERRALWERALASLSAVAEHASDRGVRLGIEPLNRFETSLLCLAEHAADFVDKLDNPAAGVLLDTYHMNIEEADMPAAIRGVGDRLVHFHANENHRGAPGTGHVDWPAVGAAIRETGFDGTVVTEPFRRPSKPGESLALWRPPADPSAEDRVAASALAFLREHLG